MVCLCNTHSHDKCCTLLTANIANIKLRVPNFLSRAFLEFCVK